jgi:hypothetical protein
MLAVFRVELKLKSLYVKLQTYVNASGIIAAAVLDFCVGS